MSLSVFINGVDRSRLVLWRSLSWRPALTDKVDILSFQIQKFGDRTYSPEMFDEVLFYDDEDLVFGGNIMQVSESIEGVDRKVFSITCKDWTNELDRRLVVERYTDQPVINILCDILNRYINKGKRVEIATFEATEIWQGDGAADTVNFRVGRQARKLTSTNLVTETTFRDIVVNLNPATFADTDRIEMDVYVDDITALDSVVIKLGDADLTNRFEADITALLTQDGWNLVKVAREDFTEVGTFAWEDVQRIQIEATAASGQEVNVTFDNWQLLKTTAFTRDGSARATQIVRYLPCNYEQPSKVFAKMADRLHIEWYVDANKDIKFFGRFDLPAPFDLSDTNGNYVYSSLVRKESADQIRNGIFVRGSEYLAAPLTQDLSNQADGSNKIFLLGYKYADYSLTLDGVPVAVGVANLQQYNDNNGASQTRTGGSPIILGDASARQRQSQQVIVTAAGKRAKIQVRLRKVGAPADNVQLQIFEDSGSNTPSATALSDVAIYAGTSLTTSMSNVTFDLVEANPGDLVLPDSGLFHIVMSRSGAVDPVNYYEIDAVAVGGYEGLPNTYNGSAWSTGTSVFHFTEKLDFDVLYSFMEKVLKWNTAPAGGSEVIWTAKPYFRIIVRYNDTASASQYGTFEYKIDDPTIKTQDGARQRALAELQKLAQSVEDVTFTTYRSGLRVGQTINVQSTLRGINLNLIIMGISTRPRTSQGFEYSVTCALTRSMNMIYWLQEQVLKDMRDDNVDDSNELFDRVDSLAEIVYPSVSYTSELLVGRVWSNDAGTTPNALVWNGGLDHIWI